MIQFNKQKKNMNEANMKNKYVDDDDGKNKTTKNKHSMQIYYVYASH